MSGITGVGRLQGRVAFVTGGSSGIGQATCLALARAGAHVIVVGRDGGRVQDAVDQVNEAARGGMGGEALGIAETDVRDEAQVTAAVARALDRFGRIDVLVVAAGIGRSAAGGSLGPCPVSRLPVDAWEEVIDTNVTAVFLCVRAVLPSMLACGAGQIVCVSSARAAVAGQPYAAAYSASKFALMGFTDALAVEVQPQGIRVHTVLPDAVDTPLIRGANLAPRGALRAAVVGRFIVDLLALPEDVLIVHPRIAPFGAAATAAVTA